MNRKRQQTNVRLLWAVWVSAALLAASFIGYVLQRSGTQRDELLQKMAETAFAFLLIGLAAVGARVLFEQFYRKREVDAQQRLENERDQAEQIEHRLVEERQRQARLDTMRMAAVARLVEAANHMYQAEIIIEAGRSAQAYSEQVRSLVGTRFDLRCLCHELRVGGGSALFNNGDEIRQDLDSMQNYIDRIAEEYRAHYQHLADLQGRIDGEKDPDAQNALRVSLWGYLQELERVAELMEENPLTERLRRYENEHERVATGDDAPQAGESRSLLVLEFVEPYEEALKLMQAQILLGQDASRVADSVP